MKFTHRDIQTEERELDISVDEIQRMRNFEKSSPSYNLEPIQIEDF